MLQEFCLTRNFHVLGTPLRPYMHYKNYGFLIRKAATIISVLLLLFVILLSRCSRNGSTAEKDAATIDSLNRNTSWFFTKVNVDLIAYSTDDYTLLVKAEADHGDRKVNHDTISFFVNNRKMEYSVGVGNYSEQTPAYHLSFDEQSYPGETLQFTIRLKDSTHLIGTIDIRPIMAFVANKDLHADFVTDKSKPFTIDWGGPLPDSLTIMQVKHVKNGNAESIESNLLADQHWNTANPVVIDTNALNSGADTFEIAWWKEGKGVSSHKKITCEINAIARTDQQITVR
jgi:hypothetical protein